MVVATRSPLFQVRKSRIQGKGVFALRTIRRGTRIAEYEGERISAEEATRRYDDLSMKRHHTFLFDVDGHTCIDGAVGGNDSRFINHSCEPNCEAIQEDDRIFVVALRTIHLGEELTYDYRYIVEGPVDDALRKLYACKCGAPTCRGTILQPDTKPAKSTPKKRGTSADGTRTKSKTRPRERGDAHARTDARRETSTRKANGEATNRDATNREVTNRDATNGGRKRRKSAATSRRRRGGNDLGAAAL